MKLGEPEIMKGWKEKGQNLYCREVLYQEIFNFRPSAGNAEVLGIELAGL